MLLGLFALERNTARLRIHGSGGLSASSEATRMGELLINLGGLFVYFYNMGGFDVFFEFGISGLIRWICPNKNRPPEKMLN
jgi:hypothetical protein